MFVCYWTFKFSFWYWLFAVNFCFNALAILRQNFIFRQFFVFFAKKSDQKLTKNEILPQCGQCIKNAAYAIYTKKPEKVVFSFNLFQNLFVNFLTVFLVEGTAMFPCTGKTVVSGWAAIGISPRRSGISMGLRKAPNSSDPACQSSMDSAVVQTDLTPSKIWKMGKLIGNAPHILQSKTAFRLETSKCVKMLHTLLGEKL